MLSEFACVSNGLTDNATLRYFVARCRKALAKLYRVQDNRADAFSEEPVEGTTMDYQAAVVVVSCGMYN